MSIISHSDFLRDYPPKVIDGKGTLEVLQSYEIGPSLINSIHNIESDMWAHGLGEYRKCTDCLSMLGKQDIYSDPAHIKLLKRTVNQLERIFGSEPSCPQCGGKTERVFGEEYKKSIEYRYSQADSLICVLRDIHGDIRGFMDGYVGDIRQIYKTEFEDYYHDVGSGVVSQEVSSSLGGYNDKLLCITSLGTDPESGNMFNIYALMKFFFESLLYYYGEVHGVYESVLGSNTHGFYAACGGYRTHISSLQEKGGYAGELPKKSDIFVHKNIATSSLESLGESLKEFLSKNKSCIRETIEKHK